MSLVAKILSPSHVVADLQASSKKRLFEQVGLLFENQHGIARSVVFDSLFARERLGSTGLGQGVAIPHGRIKGLKEALGAFVRLAQPVPFDAPDGQPVSLVFVLLVPEQATEKHLQILSELAQMFSDRALREAMLSAPTPRALHQLDHRMAAGCCRSTSRSCMTTTARRCRSPGSPGAKARTAVRREAAAAASLIGHLNLTHPNSIQVIGAYEAGMVAGFVERLFESPRPRR